MVRRWSGDGEVLISLLLGDGQRGLGIPEESQEFQGDFRKNIRGSQIFQEISENSEISRIFGKPRKFSEI